MQTGGRLDILLMIPLQPFEAFFAESSYRRTVGAHLHAPIARGYAQLAEYVGLGDLRFNDREDRPMFGGEAVEFSAHRTLSAVALATSLEAGNFNWKVIDAGSQRLGYYRLELEKLRDNPPRCVGISTTFMFNGLWLRSLIRVVRSILPSSKIVLGGSYHVSNTRDFLSMDADVFCIGEGEIRINQIVRAIRDGTSLDTIDGIYTRRPDGSLHSTGVYHPPPLQSYAPLDWKLVERIEPTMSLDKDIVTFNIESQRGCTFRCEFCSYATMARFDALDVQAATKVVLDTKIAKRGMTFLIDSTATYPRERWEAMMRELIANGGSPHHLSTFARVSDIREETADLMSRAGVKLLLLGIESGDQDILNKMKKGTRVEQLPPAIRALAKHGISAVAMFMHGLPGETPVQVAHTREALVRINDECRDRPVARWYNVYPLMLLDYAPVVQSGEVQRADQYTALESKGEGASARWAAEEVLATFIAVSRVPHGPVWEYIVSMLDGPNRRGLHMSTYGSNPDLPGLRRWVKSVEQGIAAFVEHDLDGKRLDDNHLRRLREEILAPYPESRKQKKRPLVRRGLSHVLPRLVGRLQHEWVTEDGEAQPLTRTLLALQGYRETGSLDAAVRTLRSGHHHSHPASGEHPVERTEAAIPPPPVEQVDTLATELITQSTLIARASRHRVRDFIYDQGSTKRMEHDEVEV